MMQLTDEEVYALHEKLETLKRLCTLLENDLETVSLHLNRREITYLWQILDGKR